MLIFAKVWVKSHCGIDGFRTLVHTIHFADGSWQPFYGGVQDVLPQGPNIGQVALVACATNQNGDLHVCAASQVGGIWHTIRFADGSWQHSFDLVPMTPDGDIGRIVHIACAAGQNNEVHLCVVTQAGDLFHTIRFADGNWQPIFEDVQSQARLVGPDIGLPLGGVACTTNQNNDLHVCVVTAIQGETTDGQFWYTFRHSDGSWSDFDNVLQELNVLGAVLNVSVSHT